jgi:glycosyltransferase involved in cell wall biosynthesis
VSDSALTILFATRNGEHVLRRTLEAYCGLEAPAQAWKMVIVDNGSDDLTPAILESFKERLPLESLEQPIAGKNRALNCGLRAIEGRLVIVTDDDAIPNSSFLTAWSKYLDKQCDHELFGGSIDPLFEVPPPKWILKSNNQFDFLYAARDLDEGPIAANEIFGPNMAVRSAVFERGFRFKEDIGPDGSDPGYPMGSETEFCCRVGLSGAKAWFAKEPRVQHLVRRSQLARSYWAKRAYQHGRGVAQQAWEQAETRQRGALLRLELEQLLRLPQMVSPFPLQRFNGICEYHWRRGFRDEWVKRSTAQQRQSL